VKIAGEDVVEEPVAEPALDAIPGYGEETRLRYAGGLPKKYRRRNAGRVVSVRMKAGVPLWTSAFYFYADR
jgi:hypothetical protein